MGSQAVNEIEIQLSVLSDHHTLEANVSQTGLEGGSPTDSICQQVVLGLHQVQTLHQSK
jgi:hypothetical protein